MESITMEQVMEQVMEQFGSFAVGDNPPQLVVNNWLDAGFTPEEAFT